MKTNKSLKISITLLITVFSCISSATAISAPGKYVFGMCQTRNGAGMDSQYKVMMEEILKAFSAESGIKIEAKFFSENSEFLSAAKSGKVDFAMTSRQDDVYAILKSGKMTPFLTIALYGKKTSKNCIYTKGKSDSVALQALKGKSLLTYDSIDSYIKLRKLLQVKPEDFFDLKISPNAFSSIYA
ncbi:MAG TPA: PhnD/SsuA/transferrin family substrate-binding protein, partial [bacterium]|nr:PhnD/SsuA/transferrin family substrate-binding protein [bacterium]